MERENSRAGTGLAWNPELHNLKLLYAIYVFLIYSLYIMPQYFGIRLGVDITCTRLANIMILLYMLFSTKMFTHFFKISVGCSILYPLLLYLAVTGYTMVLRVDINAFFMPFIEVLTLFMLIYGIRYVVGYKRALRWSIHCAYFLGVYGLIEFVCGESLFLKFLSTVPNNVSNFYRSGQYRIMGPCGHSLGYGLLLLIFMAIASYDEEHDELDLFKRPALMLLLYLNIFLTGSRSSLALAVLETVIIIVLSRKDKVKKALVYLGIILVAGVCMLFLLYETSIGQYAMGQIASVVDTVLGTEYAANYGIDTERLEDSSAYREALPYIFTLDWLNPLVGRGMSGFNGAEINGVFIHSIDHYYVMQYIKYAYPGLITYLLFMLVFFLEIVHDIIKNKSGIAKMVLVASFIYFLNLIWVDALQTLKFIYTLIAIYYAYRMTVKATVTLTATDKEVE